MRLVSFRHKGRDKFGAVVGDGVIDLTTTIYEGERSFADLRDVFALGAIEEIRAWVPKLEPDLGLTDIAFTLPITRPAKILCIGRNYRAYHEVQEMGAAPKWPSIFPRFVDSFVPHDAAIVRPRESDQLDYEGELAVVIGKGGRHIAPAAALSHVGGYTILNEGSVRDWQSRGTQNCPGKNFWHSGSIGPWIVTADEIPDPSKLHITTKVNGAVRQDGGTDMMIFDIPFLITHISQFTELAPGDIIATGSPGGSAIEMKPQAWLKPGDRLEITIAKIGTLSNPIAAE
ncbi:MAG: fumarylacetoacetate hydrolase family protein [Alphaproteobacteria bacterium]|nr:fumarylacetoacetate hydrolase family protein [Alphaproteobacteria bacterium]